MVESDRGDSLSPKYAPEMMAPAVMAGGMPRPAPTPYSAMPTVPTVDQEEPVDMEKMAQIIMVATMKILGLRTFRP